jgi:hypothetical protein
MNLKAIGEAFSLPGNFEEAFPYGSGHINDTYCAVYGGKRYIHQRINHSIFKDPVRLMENVSRVTAHQQAGLASLPAAERGRRSLTTLQAKDGKPYFQDEEGNTWRSYHFIEGARTYDVIEHSGQAVQAAKAFGAFQKSLADLPGGRLVETIPNFHNTPLRFQALMDAAAKDPLGRLKDVKADLDFALSRKSEVGRLVELLEAGELPERVTHNDTKINNVMLDDATGEGICVIDLDTVMPGLAAYDFGELLRTSTLPCKEDESDLSKVLLQWDRFEAVADGYMQSAASFLTPKERETLALGGWMMSFENGMRFLTDYLLGDSYYKIKRPGQNLDRSRCQMAMAREVEKNLSRMNAHIAAL